MSSSDRKTLPGIPVVRACAAPPVLSTKRYTVILVSEAHGWIKPLGRDCSYSEAEEAATSWRLEARRVLDQAVPHVFEVHPAIGGLR